MNNQKGYKCPNCGENCELTQSIIKGHKVCSNCGYCATEGSFQEMDITEPDAPNRYLLDVDGGKGLTIFAQLHIPEDRAMFLCIIIKQNIMAELKGKKQVILHAGNMLKSAAVWCKSPAELVFISVFYANYMHQLQEIGMPFTLEN